MIFRLLFSLAVSLVLVTTPTLAETAAHEGGLPQFDASFFLTQLFWLTVIFGTFYILIQGVGVPGVVRVLESRNGKIAFDITRATELRNEAHAVTAIIEDKLVHARDHARTILSLANHEVDCVSTARLSMYDARIGARVREAEQRIARAREIAVGQIPALAGDLATDLVVRLGGGVVSNDVGKAVSTVLQHRAAA